MSDQISNLITNLGILIGTLLPFIALRYKWSKEELDQNKKYIMDVIAAIAVVAASMFAVWNARHAANTAQQNKIEAVKALNGTPQEHKEERAKFLGVAPK